jgi:hypothetical protein
VSDGDAHPLSLRSDPTSATLARRSCVKRYTKRWSTRLEHAEEIKRADGLRDYASAEAELAARVDVLGLGRRGRAEGHLRRCGDPAAGAVGAAAPGDHARTAGDPGAGADLTRRRFSSRIRHERF